ncbi:uncharacterized protein QC763_211652 [Podospora pseudopauciseta]|uniref:Uncharacterized protein n=1 Tax=Podospora pseudopauciseta TaxID=2093780 RepID=A0ABR0HRQ7_9PEZI|nr:hypothetical protein QC763_211652 [Podospora pseudopauciseta]
MSSQLGASSQVSQPNNQTQSANQKNEPPHTPEDDDHPLLFSGSSSAKDPVSDKDPAFEKDASSGEDTDSKKDVSSEEDADPEKDSGHGECSGHEEDAASEVNADSREGSGSVTSSPGRLAHVFRAVRDDGEVRLACPWEEGYLDLPGGPLRPPGKIFNPFDPGWNLARNRTDALGYPYWYFDDPKLDNNTGYRFWRQA